MASAHYHDHAGTAKSGAISFDIAIPDDACFERSPFLLMKINTGCRITGLGTTANPLQISHMRDRKLSNKKSGEQTQS
jgi:hypothetical protein